ncbi:ABC transporter permease [Providencia heimbachae]|uniref:Permease component of an ABC superfamily nickel transporter n=1 Tax=Providencia heimbachae ATCC 35613 TaxID=1354272 RepID=A0A1B7JYF7_9GAMM|nr:ABC transporter permease [Providencia heimbachae]OAT52905.1 permease component of an ABC superfamily nickel transporter [Providencia heimbachae ATCC 35613]QCJ71249.1 ABC transporter permease [Providencia heimbachae]SQH14536.1 Glutathione transport system permease protein gsiC [Providencia heimbachae]
MRSTIGLLLRFICLLTVTAAGIFILLSYSPIDPIKAYIGNDLMHVPPEQYPLIAARWGLDQPLWVQFWRWFSQMLQGDMGYSMLYNTPVMQVISDRLIPSLALLASAWVFSGVVGFALGLIAGRYLNRWPDKIISTFCYLLASIPVFWIGLLLLSLFAVSLQWAPICCAWPIGLDEQTATLSQKLQHLVLPVIALGMLGVGNIALHTRTKVGEVMNSEFIHYAQAQGDEGWPMMRFHVLKHAITPAICLQFASVGELLSGALLAEKVFAYPGLGQATIDAGLRGDIPLLMGIVMLCATLIFFSNTIADILLRKVNKGVIRTS